MSKVRGNSQRSLILIFCMVCISNSKRFIWSASIGGSSRKHVRFNASTFWLNSSTKYWFSPSSRSPCTNKSRLRRMLSWFLISKDVEKNGSSREETKSTSLQITCVTRRPPNISRNSRDYSIRKESKEEKKRKETVHWRSCEKEQN